MFFQNEDGVFKTELVGKYIRYKIGEQHYIVDNLGWFRSKLGAKWGQKIVLKFKKILLCETDWDWIH